LEDGDELEDWNLPAGGPTEQRVEGHLSKRVKDDVRRTRPRTSTLRHGCPTGSSYPTADSEHYWDTYRTVNGLPLRDTKDTARGVIDNIVSDDGARIRFRAQRRTGVLSERIAAAGDHTDGVEW